MVDDVPLPLARYGHLVHRKTLLRAVETGRLRSTRLGRVLCVYPADVERLARELDAVYPRRRCSGFAARRSPENENAPGHNSGGANNRTNYDESSTRPPGVQHA